MTKVLVTGADGFIGSHLTEMLLEQGYNVKALSYYNSFNNWGWLEGLEHTNLEVLTGDVRDAHFCNHITKDIDIIFHLAALIAIPYSTKELEISLSSPLRMIFQALSAFLEMAQITE